MPRAYDVAYGRHSNIPECCIEFFVTQWDHRSQYGEIVNEFSPVRYIPCPRCFANGNFNKLRDCVYDCGRECWREFRERFG